MRPKTDRRSKQGAESRARILEATFEIANELGYQGTSIAKVSAKTGLPASSIYWHFSDKDHLFAEMITDSFDRWWASLPDWGPVDSEGGRADAIARRIHDSIDSIASSPEFWRLGLMLALERQDVEPTARRRFIEIRAMVLDDLAEFWRRALPERAVATPEAPRLLASFTMAAADGIFVAAQSEDDVDLSALADLLAASLEAAAQRLT
ncbi:MAG: TetR/AcrR family transcriptional regulator [Acidimicrobiales bacterium]